MTPKEAALQYIGLGWSVLPLLPGTKRPAIPIASYLSDVSRFNVFTAEQHWTANPDHGVAIITGASSGIVVVDIDPRNGGDIEATRADCPTNLRAETGGGGMHLVCKHPGGTVPCGKTNRPGVDRKGDGGYIVAPPSIHPDTKRPYEWLAFGPPGDLPAWVLEAPAPTNPDGAHDPWVADALAYATGVNNGEQEATLTKLAWYFSKRLPQDIAFATLCTWAKGLPLFKRDDPWTPEHVKMKLDSAYAKRAKEDRQTTVEFDASGTAGSGTSSRTSDPDPRVAGEKLAGNAITSADFQVERHDRDDWIVTDLFADGCLCEVLGVMKAGKSTLVNQLLRCIANGEKFLGREARKQPVVYLTEQAGKSLEATLERGKVLGNPNVWLLPIDRMHGYSWRARVSGAVQLAERVGSKVIVVDTLSKLAGLTGDDENSAGAAGIVLDPWTEAKAKGIAVIFVRHARKEGGDVGTAGRGSGAITGDMDVCLYLKRVTGEQNRRELTITGRLSEEIDIHLAYDNGDYVPAERSVQQERRENKYQRLLDHIPETGAGVTARDIQEFSGLSKATVDRQLAELRDTGRLVASGDGTMESPRRYLKRTDFVATTVEVTDAPGSTPSEQPAEGSPEGTDARPAAPVADAPVGGAAQGRRAGQAARRSRARQRTDAPEA